MTKRAVVVKPKRPAPRKTRRPVKALPKIQIPDSMRWHPGVFIPGFHDY
jgi:hypothetical protein